MRPEIIFPIMLLVGFITIPIIVSLNKTTPTTKPSTALSAKIIIPLPTTAKPITK
jgi:hypothetical protein